MRGTEGGGTAVSLGDCLACRGGWPDPADRIADLGLSVAYLHDDQFFPGWTLLVLKRHATELYELARDERARLIDEVAAAAAALARAFAARKVNYGLLGNQLPHIHWHVVPRRVDDPAPRDAVWGIAHAPVRLAGAERERRIAAIRALLPDAAG